MFATCPDSVDLYSCHQAVLLYRRPGSKHTLADKATVLVKRSRRVQQMLLLLAVLGTSMTIGDGVMTATASGVSSTTLVLLCCAVLCCAVLCCAVLCCAVLCRAVLCHAVQCCAVLCYVHIVIVLMPRNDRPETAHFTHWANLHGLKY